DYETAIIGVVHQNQGSDNTRTRGHLGAQLERKAETVLCMRRDDDATLIYTTKSRGSPISRDKGPRYRWDIEAGRFVMADSKQAVRLSRAEQEKVDLVNQVMESNGSLPWADCIKRIVAIKGITEEAARKRLERLRYGGFLKVQESTGFYYIPFDSPARNNTINPNTDTGQDTDNVR
ncbi:MAG TPA: hypothetical protein PKX94_09785, partial [Opitutales bacterium]|nr:hypothetical protein [Opitutales bacterium]